MKTKSTVMQTSQCSATVTQTIHGSDDQDPASWYEEFDTSKNHSNVDEDDPGSPTISGHAPQHYNNDEYFIADSLPLFTIYSKLRAPKSSECT